jgi:hypothetical protein
MIIELIKKAAVAIPDDAVLIKVISTNDPSYTFEFIFHSQTNGWEIAEGGVVPRGPTP